MTNERWNSLFNKKGGVAVTVAIALPVLIGIAALAIDVGHLYVVRNELQNAADAGALRGARVLYDGTGTHVNEGANAEGREAAILNKSEKLAVEVNWTGGNSGDVERGHWCFSCVDSATGKRGVFTPNDSTAPIDLWNVSTAELDTNPDFINAVRVTTRRQATPASSFFSRIWGYMGFTMNTRAVAYIGFAGTLEPHEVDVPIAICKQALLNEDGQYSCTRGRMINSGTGNTSNETGGWTNYDQPDGPGDSCVQPTKNDIPITNSSCGGSNSTTLVLGKGIGLTNGEIQNVYDNLLTCWVTANGGTMQGNNVAAWPNRIWSLTLPVVDCDPDGDGRISVNNCSPIVGAVEVDVVWMTRNDKNQYNEAPRQMGSWTCPSTCITGQCCWSDFVTHFGLKQATGNDPATYENVTLYFRPNCEPHVPQGATGGENFGILAKVPKLVQ